ncbi:hypothetical protein C8A00DRAFT_35695 [Chaetomidium leptoderma]|uniref:Aminoglycoside phosphotransferase domain-containing protein n=1 Tax=Chaetomidium leptoderma TaxID=669021 RepID=A0AAN6VHM0_9PEZI|nr:hypothetical protein C8A00DRAFT_35695 [Chaetomidium leptoderma]
MKNEAPPNHSTPGPNAGAKPLPTWIKLHIAAGAFVKRASRLGPGNVIVLPFSKILKLNVPANEIAAMEFVRANTTIPVPKILDIYDRQPDGTAHILMTQIPGTMRQLTQKRKKQTPPPGRSSSSSSAAPTRLTTAPASTTAWAPTTHGGPFHSAADFHTYVRFGEPLADWAREPDVVAVHGKADREEGGYEVFFSRTRIWPRRISWWILTGGKITGIIDWEFGGWPQWDGWFEAVEREGGIRKYEVERRAEEVIWLRAGPFGYV